MYHYVGIKSNGHLWLIDCCGCGEIISRSIVPSLLKAPALRPHEKPGSQPETLIILSSVFH